MKDIWVSVFVILGLVAVFFPWIVGCIDLFWMFFTDHQITRINWTNGKVVFSFVYPVFVSMIVCIIFGPV